MSRAATTSRFTLALAIIALLAAGYFAYERFFGERPDPETVVNSSLQGVREQQRLIPLTARYVAVVTSSETQLGLKAQKTLILPGTVRYEIDLEKLTRQSLVWNASTKTLDVTLPPLEIGGPEFDIEAAREYKDGSFIMAITDSEDRLDAANRKAARKQLVEQAKAPTPMKLARRAAVDAIQTAFSMPLRAAGLEAKVKAHFADESLEDALTPSILKEKAK